MLTNNYYAYVMAQATKKTVTGGLVDRNGVVQDAAYCSTPQSHRVFDILHFLSSGNANYGVMIGSGRTPASPNDYDLESLISSGFGYSNQSAVSMSVDDSGVSVFAVYSINNTGTEPLVISEIGLFGELRYNTSSTCMALIDHTVLETPITIPAGQSKQITYTIRMNYPTA